MLVSVAEFKASPYYTDKYTDQAIQSALDYAEDRFYELTNRAAFGYWFHPREVEMVLDGTGTRLLRARYPILRLLYCGVIDRLDGTVADITSAVRVREHFLWYRPGFREGFANVHVIALCGDPQYAAVEAAESGESGLLGYVPTDVREAILRLADLKLRRKRIAGEEVVERRPGVTPPPPPTFTGDREVDGIIRTYTVARPLDLVDIRGPLSPDELKEEY